MTYCPRILVTLTIRICQIIYIILTMLTIHNLEHIRNVATSHMLMHDCQMTCLIEYQLLIMHVYLVASMYISRNHKYNSFFHAQYLISCLTFLDNVSFCYDLTICDI